MVNVYLLEQRSLCFSSVYVSVTRTVRGGLCHGRLFCNVWSCLGVQVPPALSLSQPIAWRDQRGPAPLGRFPVFANVCVWFPVSIHIIISKKGTFTFVRIIIYRVLSLIIPLSISCTPQHLHNNQTSKPEPFTGKKVFPLYYCVAK